MSSEEIYPGVVIGVVKEIDASLGRIKVDFPWLSPPQRSDWASIASPMAGGKRGVFFMPEENDEVLVAFMRGKLAHPYVVGFLWNGMHKSPESDKNLRVIKTPGGHTLRFEDVEGQKKIVLKTDGGHQINMDDTPGAGKVEVRTQGGQTLTMRDVPPTVTISLSTGTQVNLGPGGVSITSLGPLSVTAPTVAFTTPMLTVTGMLQAQVVSAVVYTPGVGNLI